MSGRVRLKEGSVVTEEAPSLLEICFNYLADNLAIISTGGWEKHPPKSLELRNGIVLPYTVCNR